LLWQKGAIEIIIGNYIQDFIILALTYGLPLVGGFISLKKAFEEREPWSLFVTLSSLMFLLPIVPLGSLYLASYSGWSAAVILVPLSILTICESFDRNYAKNYVRAVIACLLIFLIMGFYIVVLPYSGSTLQFLGVPRIDPNVVNDYLEIERFLMSDKEWFRVQILPAHAFTWMTTIRTNKSLLGGWYYFGCPTAQRYFLYLAGVWNDDFSDFIKNTDKYLKAYSYLGVKYIVVGAWLSEVIDSLKNSALAEMVYVSTNKNFYVFKIGSKYEDIVLNSNWDFSKGLEGYIIEQVHGAEIDVHDNILMIAFKREGRAIIRSQWMPIKQATKYAVVVKAKTINYTSYGMPWEHFVILRWLDERGRVIFENYVYEICNGSRDWHECSTMINPPQNAKYAEFYVSIASASNSIVMIKELKLSRRDIKFAPIVAFSKGVGGHNVSEFLDKINNNFANVVPLENGIPYVDLNTSPCITSWTIVESCLNIRINVTVTERAFLLIPYTYDPSKVKVVTIPELPSANFLTSSLGTLVVKVPRGGQYVITIEPLPNPLRIISTLLSILSMAFILLCRICNVKG
jgi:hypothetical protein